MQQAANSIRGVSYISGIVESKGLQKFSRLFSWSYQALLWAAVVFSFINLIDQERSGQIQEQGVRVALKGK